MATNPRIHEAPRPPLEEVPHTEQRDEPVMFQDTLLDHIHTRRAPATALSFVLQLALVGVVILIPLIFTQALPIKQELATTLIAPPPPPPPPPPAAATPRISKPMTSEIESGRLLAPTKIPTKVAMIKEEAAPPPSAPGVVGGVPGGVPGGQMGGVIGGVIGSVPTAAPKLEQPKRIVVSQGVTEGLLLKKVTPEYPPIARTAHIQGSVQLSAVIGKDGKIENLQVISGHPMLAQAALSAVRQWKYKPYVLNGQPVEVQTTITVNFTLTS